MFRTYLHTIYCFIINLTLIRIFTNNVFFEEFLFSSTGLLVNLAVLDICRQIRFEQSRGFGFRPLGAFLFNGQFYKGRVLKLLPWMARATEIMSIQSIWGTLCKLQCFKTQAPTYVEDTANQKQNCQVKVVLTWHERINETRICFKILN